MTPEEASSLTFFKPSEWKNLPLVDFGFARYLDEVRLLYGKPLILTDSARLPDDKPPGYSKTSLHYLGRAADLRWTFTPADLFRFVHAAIIAAAGRPIEIELVKSSTDKHAHIALFDDPTHPSHFVIAAE